MRTINVSILARTIEAYRACLKRGNSFADQHLRTIETMCEDLPHGSGLDDGVKIDLDHSTGEKIVFTFGFHHMDDNGYYCGWTEHRLIVTPSLSFGFKLSITGKDRRQVKEYLYQLFQDTFTVLEDQPHE